MGRKSDLFAAFVLHTVFNVCHSLTGVIFFILSGCSSKLHRNLKHNANSVREGKPMAGHSRQKLDLTGQRFGKLTVLGPAENIGTRTAWQCRCDCGQEIVVSTRDLRRGRRTSCGCDRSQPTGE